VCTTDDEPSSATPASGSDGDQVVGVHDLAALLGRQLPGLAADERGQLHGVVGVHPASHYGAVRPDQLDHVAGVEVAVCAGDPGRQQGPTPPDHRRDRSGVQVQPPGGARGVQQPEPAGREPGSRGYERRADLRRAEAFLAVAEG